MKELETFHKERCLEFKPPRFYGEPLNSLNTGRNESYVIPKGCFVVPFLSAVHLDKNLYEGAITFNPWRWMGPLNQEKRNWRSSPFYAPFGGGARFCPGAELARLQIALFLHYFVTTYRWTQLKEDQMSFFPSARLVNDFQIQITRRDDELKKIK
ncbi:hypothetical protein HYC85_020897 [Camellia sinensis]|uniref:Cytochrome P450 n=1 Tax=Camellia sinensis TaxID=4442 RepID=A0A7J7GSV5_CAMSI|nr:hypothetical protein HYC85_020897 [Camellia sinensis]